MQVFQNCFLYKFKLGRETIPGVKNHGSVKSSFKDIGSLMEHSSNYVHALLQ